MGREGVTIVEVTKKAPPCEAPLCDRAASEVLLVGGRVYDLCARCAWLKVGHGGR